MAGRLTDGGFIGEGAPGFYNWSLNRTRQANAPGPNLIAWGPITFDIYPMNVHEYDHATATDWAEKEIAGAPIYREWVGEDDEFLNLRGRVFPHHKIGGLPQMEAFEAMRRAGIANQMVRSDGWVFGWFVCERLTRCHEFLAPDGVGSQISFEGIFARVPVPEPSGYAANLFRVLR